MERIEVNVVTGERTVIPLTAAEIADVQARTAQEAATPRPRIRLNTDSLADLLVSKGVISRGEVEAKR